MKNGDGLDELIAERAKTHGDFRRTAKCAQGLKDAMRLFDWSRLSPDGREALDLMMQKVARILTGDPNEPDHWRDLAGYARLVERILTEADLDGVKAIAAKWSPLPKDEATP